MLGLERLQTERQRVLVLVREIYQRAEEVVPREHELEQRDNQQRGLGEWQDDLPEDTQLAATVDARRLGQILRDGHEELAEQKDVERAGEEARHPERLEGADRKRTR